MFSNIFLKYIFVKYTVINFKLNLKNNFVIAHHEHRGESLSLNRIYIHFYYYIAK